MNHKVVCGDTLVLIKDIPRESIDLLVTSPPYWAKRVYNGGGQIGSESTPEEYVQRLADFFCALQPYLKKTANIFINIGDTFFGSGAGAWSKYDQTDEKLTKQKYHTTKPLQPKIKQNGKLYQNKQLLLIPARFAIEMQNRGWILRDDIIWHKPNRIPSGVQDRFINTYEHVYHFVLQRQYYFDLDAVKILGSNGKMKNPGDIWSINTQPLDGPHTATFPEKLIEQIILCGSPESGTVFDPFLGTGTTWIVADRLNRSCVGFEINQEFFDYAQKRYRDTLKQGCGQIND